VSSRLAEKERRLTQRAERELRRHEQALRARRLRLAGAVALAVVLAGSVTAAVIVGSSGSNEKRAGVAVAERAFGQHYVGLVRRRQQAGVPTMMQTMKSRIHYHPVLSVFVNGRSVTVPANIGIDPTKDPMDMAGLHTHDAHGTIHVEGTDHATLGKFFQIWGVPLSALRLGPYRAQGRRTVRMWVNGRPSRAFGALKLADRQRIVVSYGSSSRPPSER
jgi:hypothetical protein